MTNQQALVIIHAYDHARPSMTKHEESTRHMTVSCAVRAVADRYDNPFIWVLENGISEKGEAKRTGDAALQDPLRTKYFRGYISETCR